MWRILVESSLRTACTISRTITRRLGHSDFASDKTSLRSFRQRVANLVESGHAVTREKSLASGCAGGVTRSRKISGDRRALSHRFGFTVGWGAVSDPGDGASGGGTRGGRLAATPALGKRVKEGFNPVRSARRGKRTPEETIIERAEGTVKALAVGDGMPLDPGLHRRPGRPAFAAGRADSSPGEGVLHLRAAHALSKPGRPVELGVAYDFDSWSKDQASEHPPSQAVVEGRRRGGRGAESIVWDVPTGTHPTRRQARERAFAAMSGGGVGATRCRFDRVRTHGTEGFARMVALSVLAGNLLGRLLRQQEPDARKRRRRHAA